jgi:hypothetical protein
MRSHHSVSDSVGLLLLRVARLAHLKFGPDGPGAKKLLHRPVARLPLEIEKRMLRRLRWSRVLSRALMRRGMQAHCAVVKRGETMTPRGACG